jgi:hypothetical protein
MKKRILVTAVGLMIGVELILFALTYMSVARNHHEVMSTTIRMFLALHVILVQYVVIAHVACLGISATFWGATTFLSRRNQRG